MSRAFSGAAAFLVSGFVPLLAAAAGVLFVGACAGCKGGVRQASLAPIAAGSFDDIEVDQKAHQMYLADQAASGVDVVSIYSTTPQFVSTIDVGGTPNGLALAPDRHLLYAGLSGGTVAVIDIDPASPHVNQMIGQITVDANNADLMDYSPQRQRLYVSTGGGESVVGIDTVTNQVKERFDTKVGVQQPRYDPAHGMVYATTPTTNSLLQIDPSNGRITRTFVVDGCRPGGLAINPNRQLAMLGCPSTMAVVNPRTGGHEVTSSLQGADLVTYDSGADRLVAASPHGKLDSSLGVFDGTGNFLGSVSAMEKSHAAVFDDAHGFVYAPSAAGLMSFTPAACTPPPEWLKFVGGLRFLPRRSSPSPLPLHCLRAVSSGPRSARSERRGRSCRKDLAAERERMRALEDAMLGPRVNRKIQV